MVWVVMCSWQGVGHGSAGRGMAWNDGLSGQAGWLGRARQPPQARAQPASQLVAPPLTPNLARLPARPPACLQSVTDKLKEKLSGDEKEKVEKAVQAALDWMDENQVGGCWPGGCWQECLQKNDTSRVLALFGAHWR